MGHTGETGVADLRWVGWQSSGKKWAGKQDPQDKNQETKVGEESHEGFLCQILPRARCQDIQVLPEHLFDGIKNFHGHFYLFMVPLDSRKRNFVESTGFNLEMNTRGIF